LPNNPQPNKPPVNSTEDDSDDDDDDDDDEDEDVDSEENKNKTDSSALPKKLTQSRDKKPNTVN
jgi:hypothetical protein